ncbi:MAG: flavodoxin [Treponema sp.]|nr:flavodoxin [Treponema sp.]
MQDTIIVYFSLEGNVDFLAHKIAEKLNADIFRLETVKEYHKSGLLKFLHGGKDVTFGIKPELKNTITDFSKYSHIILGTPIWAGKPSSPLNSFLDKIDFQKKFVSVFTSCAGSSSDNCVSILERMIVKRNGILCAKTSFVNPIKNESNASYMIENFCKKISEKIASTKGDIDKK